MSGDCNEMAIRLLRLVTFIDGHGSMPTTQAIADHLGVCHRTVYRYLNALEYAGWHIPSRRRDEQEAA